MLYDYQRGKYKKKRLVNTFFSKLWSLVCTVGIAIIAIVVIRFLWPWLTMLFTTVK